MGSEQRAERGDLRRQREETDVSARERWHSKDADAERAARRIQGTSQCSDRRAGSAHARERAERAAATGSAKSEEAADMPGVVKGPLLV